MEEDVRDVARRLLAGVEDKLPFKVNEVTNPDENPILATVRGADGYPVLAPHPESISILSGRREVFEMLVLGPKVIRDLLDKLDGYENQKPQTAKKTPAFEA